MGFGRCVTSAINRAAHPDRLTDQFYIDDDDAELSLYGEVLEKLRDEYDPTGVIFMGKVGDSIGCPRAANALALYSDTDIVMMCGDDLVFTDDGWDVRLDEDAAKYPDDLFLFWFSEEQSRHAFFLLPDRQSPLDRHAGLFPADHVRALFRRSLGDGGGVSDRARPFHRRRGGKASNRADRSDEGRHLGVARRPTRTALCARRSAVAFRDALSGSRCRHAAGED